MSRPMSFQELNTLLSHIANEHHFLGGANKGKSIKYVHPIIDMRDGMVFSITFRGLGIPVDGHNLHTTNEGRDIQESLFDRCMTYLDEE